jgi:hypothetical protein
LGRSMTPTERAQLARMGDEVTAEGLRQIIGEEEFTRYFDPDGSGDMSMNLEIGGEIRQEQYLRDQQYRMARRRADETGQPQRYLVDPDNPDPRLRYGTLLPNTPEYRQRIAGRSGRRSEQRYAETQARIRARRAERQTDIEAANAPVESDEQWRQSRYAELMDESTSIAGQIEELENRESLTPAEQNRLESLQEEHQRVSGRMDYYEQQQQRAEQAAATPQTYRESWDAYRGQTMELVQSGLISYQQAIAQFEPTAYLTESQLADPSIRNEVSRQMQQFRRAAIQYSNQPEALEALYKDMVRWLNNYITGEALPLSEAQQVDDRIRNYDVFEVNPDLADESLLADEVERIQTAGRTLGQPEPSTSQRPATRHPGNYDGSVGVDLSGIRPSAAGDWNRRYGYGRTGFRGRHSEKRNHRPDGRGVYDEDCRDSRGSPGHDSPPGE